MRVLRIAGREPRTQRRSHFSCATIVLYVKNVLWLRVLGFFTRPLGDVVPQTLSYSSAHSSASPSPVGTSFLKTPDEQIAWNSRLLASSAVQMIDEFSQMQFLGKLMSQRLVPGRDLCRQLWRSDEKAWRSQFLDNFDTVVSSSSVFQLRSTWALLSLFFFPVVGRKQ